MVRLADMGRGGRGKGLSDSIPVWDRHHGLLGSATGEHPGPATGTQRSAPGIGQELSGHQQGGHDPARTSRRSSTSWSSRSWTSTPSSDTPREPPRGLIQVPGDSVLGIFEPRQLQLNAAFNGPTYGGGITLQGGFKVSDWRDLTTFVVADLNKTKTDLSFENETLIARTKPVATVFSARVGLHGTVGSSTSAGIWIGAMYQKIQQTVAGDVANTDLQFVVLQSPSKPWNTLVGGIFEWGKDGYLLLEGGLGARMSILAAAGYRF
jgi:hypothetical protein